MANLGLDRLPAALAISLLLTAGSVASAQDSSPRMFSLSGFGSLGIVHSDEDQADYVADVFVPDGAGHTRDWSAEVDSRLGVQLVGTFTPRLSATLQLVAEQAYDGNYGPQVDWANVKYQLTRQFSLRVGRTALASFLVSDSRKVGYTNPWVRPPTEVYGLVPVVSADGVDASYHLELGSFVHTFQGGVGQRNIKSYEGTRTESRDMWILSDTVEVDDLTLRIVYQQASLSIDSVQAAMAPFWQFGPQGIALARRYDPAGKKVTFAGVGGIYDPGAWFAMAEWGQVNFRSVLGRRSSWYASGGYRTARFTPYLTYAVTGAESERTSPGLTLTGLPPQLVAPAAALNGALNGILGSLPVQRTVSLGTRWDFMANVALKLQFDHVNLGAGSAGTLQNLQPGLRRGGNLNLFAATIDYVW